MEEWVNKLETGFGTVFKKLDPTGALLNRATKVGNKYIEDFRWHGVPTEQQENITAVIIGAPIHLPFDNSRKGRGDLNLLVAKDIPAEIIKGSHAFQPDSIPSWFIEIYNTMIDEMLKGEISKLLIDLEPNVVKQVKQEILDLKRYKPYLYYSTWAYVFANSNRATISHKLQQVEEGQKEPVVVDFADNKEFGEKFQEAKKSKNLTKWYGIILKEDSPTKKLYEVVRTEMHSPDVYSIEDLMKKVEAHGFKPMPTKEQVQKVIGYILTRGRIK